MHARPPGLHESMRAHHVRMARAQQHTSHRPERPTLSHSLACVAKRAAADHTSSARHPADELVALAGAAEHRGYHHERLQGTRRDRGRASARAAARAVAVVMTTVAPEVHVEHVGAVGRRPARDCAALRVAETLQGSSPGPGPLIQSTGAAGEPLQRTRKTAVYESDLFCPKYSRN